MDSFFSTPFLQNYPANLKSGLFNDNSLYLDLNRSISKGRIQVGVHRKDFLNLIEKLKSDEPELAKALLSLEAAGKIRGITINEEVPSVLKSLTIKKSVLKRISGAYAHDTDTLFHDFMEQESWIDQIVVEGSKPVFLHDDLNNGDIEYLFKEKSFSLNVGDPFNWSRFLVRYVLPFSRIRILDPYLYVNILHTDLSGMLKTLIKKSRRSRVKVEIISDLGKDNRKKDQVLDIVKSEIEKVDPKKIYLALYDQKSNASNLFHKRLIWTDFWTLYTDRGFDFLKIETGKGTVKRENTLLLSGKYASGESVWHQVESNWDVYLSKSKKALEL